MFRVKVSDEVHTNLLKLKKQTHLTLNEIVNLGTGLLLDRGIELHSDSSLEQVTVNLKKTNLDYNFVEMLTNRGYDIFIPGLNSHQSIYLKRMISKKLNVDVLCIQATNCNVQGFLFLIKKK